MFTRGNFPFDKLRLVRYISAVFTLTFNSHKKVFAETNFQVIFYMSNDKWYFEGCEYPLGKCLDCPNFYAKNSSMTGDGCLQLVLLLSVNLSVLPK